MSEVANTAVVLGLHQEKKIGDTTPFFLCELRIRFVDQIYSHDKVQESLVESLWLSC